MKVITGTLKFDDHEGWWVFDTPDIPEEDDIGDTDRLADFLVGLGYNDGHKVKITVEDVK